MKIVVKFSLFKYPRGSWQKWTGFSPTSSTLLATANTLQISSFCKEMTSGLWGKGICQMVLVTVLYCIRLLLEELQGLKVFWQHSPSQWHWLTCCIQVAFQLNSLPANQSLLNNCSSNHRDTVFFFAWLNAQCCKGRGYLFTLKAVEEWVCMHVILLANLVTWQLWDALCMTWFDFS